MIIRGEGEETFKEVIIAIKNKKDLSKIIGTTSKKVGKIIVNPLDVDRAARFFNKNIINTDASVSGGLIAVNTGGKIVVDNTFEKRLERKWPQLLPELINSAERKYGESGSA